MNKIDYFRDLDLHQNLIYNSGFEIVDELPANNLFNGRIVTMNHKKFIFKSIDYGTYSYPQGWYTNDECNPNLLNCNDTFYVKLDTYEFNLPNPLMAGVVLTNSTIQEIFEIGKTYTLSYDMKVNSLDGNGFFRYGFQLYNFSSSADSPTFIKEQDANYPWRPNDSIFKTILKYNIGEYYHFQRTFTWKEEYTTQRINLLLYNIEDQNNSKISSTIKNIKIEDGNYATKWCYNKNDETLNNVNFYHYEPTESNTSYLIHNYDHKCGTDYIVQIYDENNKIIEADVTQSTNGNCYISLSKVLKPKITIIGKDNITWNGGGGISNYIILDYIIIPNKSYFDSNYLANENSRIVGEVSVTDTSIIYHRIFGSRLIQNYIYSGVSMYVSTGYKTSGGQVTFGSHEEIIFGFDGTINYTFDISKDNIIINNKTFNNDYINRFNNETLIIGGTHDTTLDDDYIDAVGSLKYYHLQIYENNILIRNYLPAKKSDEDIYGMFDTINQIFYSSDNDIPFIY